MIENQNTLDARAARLLYAYALAVDTSDLDALESLAVPDVQFTSSAGTLVGVQSFLDVFRAQFSSDCEQTRHVVTNLMADRRGDGLIEVQAYFEATEFRPGATRRLIGSYHDVLCEVEGKLKIAHKKISVQRVLKLPRSEQRWASASVAVIGS